MDEIALAFQPKKNQDTASPGDPPPAPSRIPDFIRTNLARTTAFVTRRAKQVYNTAVDAAIRIVIKGFVPVLAKTLFNIRVNGTGHFNTVTGDRVFGMDGKLGLDDALNPGKQGKDSLKFIIARNGKNHAIAVNPERGVLGLVADINKAVGRGFARLSPDGHLAFRNDQPFAIEDVNLGQNGIAALGHRFGRFDVTKEPTLVVANHVSMLDALMLSAMLPVDMAFAIDKGMYNSIRNFSIDVSLPLVGKIPGLGTLANAAVSRGLTAVLNPLVSNVFLPRMPLYPIDMARPQAIRELTRLAQQGKPVMIFPEGRLTTNGTLMQIYDGAGMVAEKSGARIVPVYLEGFQYLPGPATRLNHYPKKNFPGLGITVTPPQRLSVPEEAVDGKPLSAKQRRAQGLRALKKIMHELPVRAQDSGRTLMDAVHYTAQHFGWSTPIVDDPIAGSKTYEELLTGAYAIGGQIAKTTKPGESVGFLMPPGVAGTVAFLSAPAFGRVATMFNYTSDAPTLVSCAQTTQTKTIVTARAFVEKAGLQAQIDALSKTCTIRYLEDIKTEMSAGEKLKASLTAKGYLPRPRTQGKGQDPAVILFTSGSEGPPKGVVLSSANLLSNVAQMTAIAALTPLDRVFNAMPIFHSFGLLGGLLLPVLKGMRSMQFPSPLMSSVIPRASYDFDATIMFGTDKFLSLYEKRATNEDFSTSLRYVFAGAEKLKDDTYNAYLSRFQIPICEGYGMTEASPVVAVNVRGAYKRGTVGKFLPGIETRLEDVPGVENGKRLFIKGPNVMLGYMRHDNPGVIEPPRDGWHDTGDIVDVDTDGFVKIAGRLKRFIKVGGEMVSLDKIEALSRLALAPEKESAVVAYKDKKDNEAAVLFTTDPHLKREAIVRAANEQGLSPMGLPQTADIHILDSIPKLGTGKTDYVTLSKLKADFVKASARPKADDAEAEPQQKPAAALAPPPPPVA